MSGGVGYEAEFETIRDRFEEGWGDETPVSYPNQHFKRPGTSGGGALGPWARFSIVGSVADIGSIGGSEGLYRHDGDVIVEVFVPQNTGNSEVLRLSEKAAGIFRGWIEGRVAFWAPRIVEAGTNDGFYQMNVIAPFQRDEIFAHQ